MIDYFLKEFTASHGKTVTAISPAVRKALMAYSWPGNVRELKNTIESMVVIDSDGILDVDDLTEDIQAVDRRRGRATAPAGVDTWSAGPLEEIEKYYIAETLKLTSGNREEAAKLLGHRRADALSQDQGIHQTTRR